MTGVGSLLPSTMPVVIAVMDNPTAMEGEEEDAPRPWRPHTHLRHRTVAVSPVTGDGEKAGGYCLLDGQDRGAGLEHTYT